MPKWLQKQEFNSSPIYTRPINISVPGNAATTKSSGKCLMTIRLKCSKCSFPCCRCACERLLGDSECIMQRASMSWMKKRMKRAFSIVPNSHIVTEVSKHAWKLLHSELFHFANSCALLIARSHSFSHDGRFFSSGSLSLRLLIGCIASSHR